MAHVEPLVWVVDRYAPCWEDEAVVADLARRGILARYIDWDAVRPERDGVRLDGEPVALPRVAYVRSRTVTQTADGELALVYDWLEGLADAGVRLVNPLPAIRACRNKVRQAQLLARAGIPVPPTRLVSTLVEIVACLDEWGTTVVKPVTGHGSIDLVRVRPRTTGVAGTGLDPVEETRIRHALRRNRVLCAQQYVPNAGLDLRVGIIDGDVVSFYRRRLAISGMEYHLQVEPTALTDDVTSVAKRAVEALGVEIATLDLVEAEHGLMVIEVNGSFSTWERIERDPRFDLTIGGITDRHGEFLAAALVAAGG